MPKKSFKLTNKNNKKVGMSQQLLSFLLTTVRMITFDYFQKLIRGEYEKNECNI